ncbi:MAG: PAS domain-containing protein [Candidatus Pacebacteria bacterium]|nr:PAS domain-containing protein [Candidatus Paceibacterota bacterium]
MKIKTKIILPIILVAVIVLSTATFYSYFFNVNTLNTSIGEHLNTTVSSRSHHIDTFIEELIGKIKIAATQENLTNEKLEKIKNSNREFSEVFLVNLDKKIIKSSRQESIGLDCSINDYLVNKKDNVYMRDAYISKINEEPSIAIAISHNKDILIIRINLEILNDVTTNKTGLGNTGEVYLINSAGYTITPLQFSEDTFLKTKIESKNAKSCLDTLKNETEHTEYRGGSAIYTNYKKIEVMGSYHPLSIMNWCILAEIDKSEALAPTKNLLKFSIIRILIILFIFFILTYLIARTISKPIIILSQGTKIIKNGNLDHKVGTNSKDEIGSLSRDFDEMTVAIKKSQIEIDKKVKEQTREIIEKQKDIENQQEAILNVLEDVENEKKKTEIERDKIDAILHSIGDGVFVVDKDKKITIFNNIAEQISGFNKEDVLGKNYLDILKFIHEKDRTPNNDFIEKAFSLGKIQMMKNHTLLIKKDKSEVPVADSSAPIKDSAGNIIGCIVVFRDATAERKAEQIKSDFVSIASHQLRTPLTGIQWVTERLLKHSTALPEKEQQYIKDINLSSKRLSTLVDSLLNVSRIEGGKITIKPEKIELIDFIKSYLTETNPLTEAKNISLKFNTHPENLEILTDRSGIRNIVQSLVSNAIEYTPENGNIEVSVEDNVEKDSFLFKIKDTGIGIPSKNQATIFDKFTRGENAQQVKTDGTGFGLYITKQTVDLLGGKIRFESIENEGTTFFVTLPKISKAKEGGKSFV